jgi:F420H(2)-dependent quinone reductase
VRARAVALTGPRAGERAPRALSVTGRRSGRTFTFPVAYHMDGDNRVTLNVDWPERKLWWRNLRDGARVELRLAGVRRTGMALAQGDERSGVSVEVELDAR